MAYSKKQIEETFKKICSRIAEGESLRNILRDDNMPSSQTFYIWLQKDEFKSKQYAHVCNERADHIFEEIILISDGTDDDVLVDEDGNKNINYHIIQRDKLRVDARKWAISKMNPKKYSDRQIQDINVRNEQPLFPDV